MKRISTSFVIIFSLCMVLFMNGQAMAEVAKEKIYFFPIHFVGDFVHDDERGFITEVAREEMLAFFWLDVIHSLNVDEKLGDAVANKVKRCKTPKCAYGYLRSKGVERLVSFTISRLKRKVYQVDAAVHSNRGQILKKHRHIEKSGQSELKYTMAGILEQLFKAEIAKNQRHITSIVQTTEVTSTNADRSLEEGDKLFERGKYDDAILKYQEAAKRSPLLSAPYRRIAKIHFKQKRFDEALKFAQKAVDTDTNDGQAMLLAGEINLALGKTQEAESQLKSALHRDGTLVKAHFLLGKMMAKNKRMDSAKKHYRLATELNPFDPNAHVNLGILYMKEESYKRAIPLLEKAIALDPTLIPTYPQLGKAYEKNQAWGKAAVVYDKLIEQMPDCAQCYYKAGRMRELEKESEDALNLYKKAIEKDAKLWDAHFSLGSLLIKTGRADEGKAILEKYISNEKRKSRLSFVEKAKKLMQ